MPKVSITTLRNRILKERGLIPPKPKKVHVDLDNPVKPSGPWLPEEFPLLPKMKYIEAKYGVKVKLDIFRGSLNDVASRYHWDVDRSTISRWRKYIRRFLFQEIKND